MVSTPVTLESVTYCSCSSQNFKNSVQHFTRRHTENFGDPTCNHVVHTKMALKHQVFEILLDLCCLFFYNSSCTSISETSCSKIYVDKESNFSKINEHTILDFKHFEILCERTAIYDDI